MQKDEFSSVVTDFVGGVKDPEVVVPASDSIG